MKRMAFGTMAGLLCGLAMPQGDEIPLAREDRVATSSIELERRVEPWCPGDCTVGVPFVAEYRHGGEHLVFVATHHAFDPQSPTMRAVSLGFSRLRPAILIAESFPTAMGVNPSPLVEQAGHYGEAGDNEFNRSEFCYALSLAIARHVPFLGAELTRKQELAVSKQLGFTETDSVFAALTGGYSQGLRSGEFPDMSPASLKAYYPHMAGIIRGSPDRGGLGLEALPFAAFEQRYREIYGVELAGDTDLPLRIDVVFDKTRMGERSRLMMKMRDRHLLALVERQLASRRSVLVVFGSSHWATLSSALEQRLGRPVVTPFAD